MPAVALSVAWGRWTKGPFCPQALSSRPLSSAAAMPAARPWVSDPPRIRFNAIIEAL